jgi:hypothetical protein
MIQFWEQNLALLRTRYSPLAKAMENEQGGAQSSKGDSFLLEQTPTGDPTLVFQEKGDSAKGPPPAKILIHSQRDPAREGQRQADAVLAEMPPSPNGGGSEGGGVIIVFGFGLGYTAEALAKCHGDNLLVIVERRSELFRLAMEQRNLEALLEPGKAVFVIGGEGIGGVLGLLENSPLTKEKPRIVKNRALVTLTEEDEAWYTEAERTINTWFSKDEINAATLRRFGKRWTRNLAANLEGVLRFPGVGYLENAFANSGVPVLLAAAGPSLGAITPYLKEIHKRCVIIAVDTSLRFLVEHGIDADFVVSVDPQYWNVRHLHRASAPKTALIAESAVYPSLLKPYLQDGPKDGFKESFKEGFKRVLFCQSLFPLGRFIEDRTDPKGALGAGGSVATTAWDFARLLAPQAIWIAGLDLAFPGRLTHYKGALFEEIAHAASRRFCPAETSSVQALESGVPFAAKAADNGKVLTDRRLSLYAAWFENRLSATAIPNYSLSSGGLAIKGLQAAQREKLLALPPCRDKVDSILDGVYRHITEDFYGNGVQKRAERYTGAVTSMVQGLEDIGDNAQEAASLIKGAGGRANDAKTEKMLKKLDKINAAIAESAVKDAAGFLFPPTLEMEKKLVETDPLKRHLEFSLLFYQSLAESVDFTLYFLKKNL